MNAVTRRTFLAVLGVSGFASSRAYAQSHGHHHGSSTPEAHCDGPMATPEVVPYVSDIPFDLAYIDSMTRHHYSVIWLATQAMDQLEDPRLRDIAQAVLDTQPGETLQLIALREEWYPDEPLEVSDERLHEMMMITMAGGMDTCGGIDHMNLMNGDWLVREFLGAENKDVRFIDLVVPHHQMAVRQSQVGLEQAEHEELRALLEDVITAQTAEIEEMLEIRHELVGS